MNMKIVEVKVSNFQQFRDCLKFAGQKDEDWIQFQNNPFRYCYLLQEQGVVCGYIDFSILYERAELNHIYIKEDYRRKKYASKLMEWMIEQCERMHCSNITLEVRESNLAAQKLYQHYQFVAVARRDKYYQTEDAILMERTM